MTQVKMAVAIALLQVLLATAGTATPSACADEGGCAAGMDDTDVQALFMKSSHQQRRIHLHDAMQGQRSDDMVVTAPPEVTKPPAFAEELPVEAPLPYPNPLNSNFTNGYIGQDCTEEKWPFFTNVPGTWKGDQGQSFIALPQADATKGFIVQVNMYEETTTFEKVGPVLNRGYLDGVQVSPTNQSDQVFMGVMFHQSVTDLDLKAGIHEENGFFLHQSCRPINAALQDPWQVTRFSAIPHGSQPMGFGNLTVVETPTKNYYVQMLLRLKQSAVFSVQPWVPGCGPREQQLQSPGNNTGPLSEAVAGLGTCCIGGAGYMKGVDVCPDTGCPEPIDMLINAAKDLNVVKYIQIEGDSTETTLPQFPTGGWLPGIRGGGVQNTAFVNVNAMAEPKSFQSMVWLLTVKNASGSTYEVIQYIETVDLKFLAKAPGCPDQLWPHVDANTLTKV